MAILSPVPEADATPQQLGLCTDSGSALARSKHATTSTSPPAAAGLTSSKIHLEVLLSGARLKTCTCVQLPAMALPNPPPATAAVALPVALSSAGGDGARGKCM